MVVSVMNPFFSFQKLWRLSYFSLSARTDGDDDLPEDSRGPTSQYGHNQGRPSRDLPTDRGELRTVTRDIAQTMSNMTLPIRAPTRDPNYDVRQIKDET
jgi:hypothetical protein